MRVFTRYQCCRQYLRHGSDDLHGDLPILGPVSSSHDLAECALPEQVDQAVSVTNHAVLLHDIVAILIINLVVRLVPLVGLLVSVLLVVACFG